MILNEVLWKEFSNLFKLIGLRCLKKKIFIVYLIDGDVFEDGDE